jgi:TPR repeat protein
MSIPFLRRLLIGLLLTGLAFAPAAQADEPPPSAASPAALPGDDEADASAAEAPEIAAKPDPSAEKFWQAMKLLEGRQTGDQAAGRKALQEASDLEYIHAQVQLANCYLSGGYGFPKDARKALALFRLAAERGNAYAMVSLGSCYVTGTGVRRDDAKAAEWLEAALTEQADYTRPVPPPDFFTGENGAGAGVAGELSNDPAASSRATAHFLLAQIDRRRNRPAEAQAHYVAATEGNGGIYQAAVEAAVNYAFGRGVPRDPARADEMIERTRQLKARLGVNLIHSYASLKFVDEFAVADLEEEVENASETHRAGVQYEIAQKFSDKKSKDYNAAEAARWYQLAADNDQVWAMLALGLMYASGELGAPDKEKAFALFEKAGGGDKPRHMLGVANLAICLNAGFGTPKDEARAAALFGKYRNRDIVCYLGTLGQAPAKPVSFNEELELLKTWAETKKDPMAQYQLAVAYYHGNGVKADPGKSFSLLKKAAKANQGDALCLLGYLYQLNPGVTREYNRMAALQQAATAYKAAGAAGNVDGLANYAVLLSNGWGVPRNEALAIATYEKCLQLEPDHSRSHSNLGEIYNRKLLEVGGGAIGTAEWREQMLAHYEASARQESALAAVKLGILYYEGRLVAKDWAKAYQYFEQATNVPANRAVAHYHLGYMHEFGQGVPVTYSEAAYHYRLAALDGNVDALRRLVNFYVTGVGVSLDFDRALYWLNILSRIDPSALPLAADVLLKKREYEMAVKLYKLIVKYSADNRAVGHAHQRLSLCYHSGQGVKKNARQAEKHYQEALKLGDGDALRRQGMAQLHEGKHADGVATMIRAAATSPEAAYNLGQMYYFGTNVPEDRPKAVGLFRKSAEMNYADAMIFLATLAWNRAAQAPSLDEAIDFAAKAENLGHPKATAIRENLERRRQAGNEQSSDDGRARTS